MPRLSDKYIAGFLDADGTIGFSFRNHSMIPQFTMAFSQKTSQDKVLSMIQEVVGGNMLYAVIKETSYSKLVINGRKAMNILNRIKQYLVLKRHYANVCADIFGKRIIDVDAAKSFLKEQRRIKSLPIPNYPSRKWLAGYFDGDGCLSVKGLSKNGLATIVAHIACSSFDTEGIETIQKNFGGAIHDMRSDAVKQWCLCMAPSKAQKFLGYFTKHLITKREQAEFILGCAAMGHFRDGSNIKAALKSLKAHDHRLSEPTVQAAAYLKDIRNIDTVKRDYLSYLPKCKRAEAIVGTRINA